MTLNVKGLYVTFSVAFYLLYYAQSHYAECYHAECRYTECRGAL